VTDRNFLGTPFAVCRASIKENSSYIPGSLTGRVKGKLQLHGPSCGSYEIHGSGHMRATAEAGMCRIRVPETLITLSDALGGKRQRKRNIDHLGMRCRQIPVFAARRLIY